MPTTDTQGDSMPTTDAEMLAAIEAAVNAGVFHVFDAETTTTSDPSTEGAQS